MKHSGIREDDTPRDRVTGVPARGEGRIADGTRSDEIEQEIRRTRARMGATLDDIEARMAPARIKRQLKGAVDDTIAEVRNEYNPRRMAQQAGDTMLDTLKHHPFAALAAGLSVGYLAMKGAEEGRTDGDYGRSGYTGSPYGNTVYGRSVYGPTASPYDEEYRGRTSAADRARRGGQETDRFSERSREAGEAYRQGAEELRGQTEEAGERLRHEAREAAEAYRHGADELRHRAEDATQETTRRARELAERAERRSSRAAQNVTRQARSAGSSIEDFIYDNPLAAGAVALGVGALIGGLFPSTDIEDRYLGPARDEAVDRARSVADETAREGKEAARRVGNEAREAARDVAEKGKQEVRKVGESAKQSASQEAEAAKQDSGQSNAGGRGPNVSASERQESTGSRRQPGNVSRRSSSDGLS